MKKIILFLAISLFIISCDEDNKSDLPPESTNIEYFLLSEKNVTLNKSGITPLVATVEFKSVIDARVGYRVLNQNDSSDNMNFKYNAISNQNTSIDIIGLYPDRNNTVELYFTDDKFTAVDTIMIQTDDVPDFFPEIEIVKNTEFDLENELYLCTFVVGRGTGKVKTYPYAYDKNGDIRWYADLSEWGNLLLPGEFTEDNTIIFGYADRIREITLAGEIKVDKVVDNVNVHHDVIKVNGNYIAAVDVFDKTIKIENGSEFTTVEDHIIEYSPSGAVLNEWDLTQILDIDRYDIVENNEDWFHMNAISYDEVDKALIVSGRNQGTVKIDWDNNLKWILSPHRGWGKAGPEGNGVETKDFLLTAINSSGSPYPDNIQDGGERASDFDWSWTQHDPEILPNGNLLIFDNGANRNFKNLDNSQSHSRIVEYKINENDATIEQVFEYGRERGSELFSFIVSSVSYLERSGNYLFCPGVSDNWSKSQVIEIDPTNGEVVFEAVSKFKRQISDGSSVIGNIDLNYRTNKIIY